MLLWFFLTCFISCFQETSQTVVNPLNLNQYGRHVCSRRTLQTQSYQTVTATTVYTATTTSCGWWGWSRCAASRARTVYHTVQRTRNVYVTIISCCSGWRKAYWSSRECGEAICSQGCHSSYGTCIAPNNCRCITGWTGSSCTADLNECASNNGGCDQVCTNTHGSYQCSCNSGYTKIGHRCQDINECLTIIPSPCRCGVTGEPCGARCTNLAPSYACSCATGFQLRSGGTICDDINECLTGNGGCQQICNNFPGKFSCGCYRGFRLTTSGGSKCEDIDECLSSNGLCSHQCVNTVGSYLCRCNSGFYLDSNGRTCSDHDECLTNHHGCQQQCNNFLGSFFCSCHSGYAINKDNKTCSDVNECTPLYMASLNKTIIPAGCDQICHNTPGNYTCSCHHGYRLLYDGKRCRDVNECNAGINSCQHICHNTPGSYGCSCLFGYKLKPDLRSCEGLPCEAIWAPPHGRMTCSGRITNETCSFTCSDGYALQGSERRTCLNSSKWDGQQTFCNVKSCARLNPPQRGEVFLPCYLTFGSSCRFGCVAGYFAIGTNLATCRATNSSEVAWDVGNFTCEEIFLCKPNPCRHGGKCIIINSRRFSCDCEHTGYKGDLCETGVVTLPEFPKLISGNPSESLELQAEPDNSLTVHFNPTMNLTIQPEKLTIQHPASKAEFQVMGNKPGVEMVSYSLDGVNKYDFTVPETSFVFIGRTVSSQNSIYTRLGLLEDELPIGCQQMKIENFPVCSFRTAFINSTKSNATFIESGAVHIITLDNKTIPLSLAGYDFSLQRPTRKEVMDRLARLTNIKEQRQTDNQRSDARECSDFQLTGRDLIELVQNDALPKSFLRYITDQLPLWLKVRVRENSNLFDIENTLVSLVRTTDAHITHPICKFPNNIQSTVVLYRPMVNYSISVENNQLSLPSKGSCFATDICGKGVFLTLSQRAGRKVNTLQFMQDMANSGWELSVSSFSFTTPRRYNRIVSSVPDGHLAEDFSDFHYNWWWQGSANIHLSDSGYAVNLKMTGEAFAFAADLNAVFTRYFSQPITSVFHGSVEFNITLQTLGQSFPLMFYSSEVIGKAKFGGTAFLASSFSDDCRVPQGFVFALERSSKPFSSSPLSNFIRPNGGLKYLQIYHSTTGGQVVSAQDNNNNLRFLEWQTQEIKRILLDVNTNVPELQSNTGRWHAVAEEMLTTVIEARRLLSQASDWLQLKVLAEKLDDDLVIMTRAFDLLVAQLEIYRNRTNIDSFINRFIKLKSDLPNTISLSFFQSSIQQKFVGLRFLLVAQICHKRLCFSNMKSSIWSLHGNQCGTSPARQEAGLLVEGNALYSISLGSLLTFPAGETLKMFFPRHSDLTVTTFESIVQLLGVKKNTTVKMTGNELSFVIWGHIFGEFDAFLNVKAQIENVADWNSIVFAVEGTMNSSSRLYKLLEETITNETTMAAIEATRRLANAQSAFKDAKRKADLVKDVLRSKQSAVDELKLKKEKAAEELRVARLKYHLAKVRFNNTFYFLENVRSLVCEIQECTYTCLNGCITPDLCQDRMNITYLERHCNTVEKPLTVNVVQNEIEKRNFAVQTYKTVYTGNCRSGVSFKTVFKYARIGAKIGRTIGSMIKGPIGGAVGFVVGGALGGAVGLLKKKIFGCSNTYEKVPAEPRLVEYDHKVFKVKAVEQIIKEVRCTGHTERTKPGGYGPPYQCCKQYGCQTKVIDPQCIINNDECLLSMTELKFTLDALNETLQLEYLSLRSSVDKVKKATFSYEKARVLHKSAVTQLKQVDAHMKQQLSAMEITNGSMVYIRRIVDFGLKIAQAMNDSDNKKVVDVDELQFSLSVASGGATQIVAQCNASTVSGKRVPVRFLVDFDQVERSITSASKSIIVKLFGGKHSRRKRSVPDDSANSTHSLHSSFTDYPYSCMFVNNTHLYFSYMLESLGDLISSVKGLTLNLSSGFYDLERLSQSMNASSAFSNVSRRVNGSSGYPNSSFVTDFLEIIQVLKHENIKLTNDSSQSWNDTLEAWRAFLEGFTSGKGFEECSNTQDCIEYLFEGAKEFYEFEDSPRALEIKEALPRLRQVIKSLTTEALSMQEAQQALTLAAFLLDKTRDESVLCGGTPRITYSSQGEVILFPGDSLALNCSAKKEGKLTYTWRRNDKLIGKSFDGTFFVDAVTKDNEGAYVCVVSNNKGSTLSNVTIVRVYSKPNITQHPEAQRVVFRSQMPATFFCNATAKPSPIFQWFFQSTNSTTVKLNETKPVLYIANPHLHQEGYYHCEASNDHGASASQRVRLDVLNYTVGLPSMLIAFNLTTECWLTSNSSNSSAQHPLQCEYNSNTLPSSLDKNLTDSLRYSLARSLNLSMELISELEYFSQNTSKSSVLFTVDFFTEPWKEGNFTSFIDIAEGIAVAETNMVEKLERFNSDVINKTFNVSWNSTTLLGEPGSIRLYPLSPECPEGQSLTEHGFICANCPAGLYYSSENDTCVECPLGTYQPVQGQKKCISCGKNLTTAFNGTVEESDCIADCPAGSYSTLKNRTCILCPNDTYQPSTGRLSCISCGQNLITTSTGTVDEMHCITDCPAGSYSTLKNRTCILCPRGTYQPSTGQLSCIFCGQNLTTTSTGTQDKMHCIKIETPTNYLPSTNEAQSTATAYPSASPTRILELQLFFEGKLVTSDMKRSKKQILDLIEEKISEFLGTAVVTEKKSEISITEYKAKVVLFINAAGVDERRLKKFLSEGFEIEYHGRKMRFTGILTTLTPSTVSDPTKDAGENKRQEGAEKSSWQLYAIVGAVLVVFIIGIAVLVIFCKRRKMEKSKSSATSTTGQFDNPTYVANENPPEITENVYSTCQCDNPTYAASEEPSERKENVYSNCEFDNPAYAASEEPSGKKENIYSNCEFDNPAYAVSEEPPEIREDEYATMDDDQIYENIMLTGFAK